MEFSKCKPGNHGVNPGKFIPNLTSKDFQGDQMKEAKNRSEKPCWIMGLAEIPSFEATF